MATETKQPTKAQRDRQQLAILYHALAKYFGKEAKREDLVAGSQSDVYVAIEATVDGEEVKAAMQGKLTVNHDSETTSSSGVDANVVLALALRKMPAATREKFIDDLPRLFDAGGAELPEVEKELVDACKAMMARLRTRKTVERKGSVSFTPAA